MPHPSHLNHVSSQLHPQVLDLCSPPPKVYITVYMKALTALTSTGTWKLDDKNGKNVTNSLNLSIIDHFEFLGVFFANWILFLLFLLSISSIHIQISLAFPWHRNRSQRWTIPEISWAGVNQQEADARGLKYGVVQAQNTRVTKTHKKCIY